MTPRLSRLLLRPKYIFLYITFFLAMVVLYIDALHGGVVDFLYTLFLSQCLAILLTTITVLFRHQSRKHVLPWITASGLTLFFMIGSVFMQYAGPHIATEADGQATVRYACLYGEDATTVNDFFGNASYERDGVGYEHNYSLAETICALRYMPLASSNLLFIHNDTYISSYLVLLASEAILAAGFFITRKVA